MGITVVWEARFASRDADNGQGVIKRIWNDKTRFAGYVYHETIVDIYDPGHVVVISHWASREAADRVLAEYRNHSNAVERQTAWLLNPGGGSLEKPLTKHRRAA